jgi:hypothetical protein
MWTLIAAIGVSLSPPSAPAEPLPLAPYVSCLDGYIAPTLAECPTPRRTAADASGDSSGGGAGGSGLLGLGIGGIL